jgi:hypothetical protein
VDGSDRFARLSSSSTFSDETFRVSQHSTHKSLVRSTSNPLCIEFCARPAVLPLTESRSRSAPTDNLNSSFSLLQFCRSTQIEAPQRRPNAARLSRRRQPHSADRQPRRSGTRGGSLRDVSVGWRWRGLISLWGRRGSEGKCGLCGRDGRLWEEGSTLEKVRSISCEIEWSGRLRFE